MPDRSGPPPLSLALDAAPGATVGGRTRIGLLTLVRADDRSDAAAPLVGAPQVTPRLERRVVIPFPAPRTPADDDPSAA
jgi:hypothetical protein